MVFKTHVRLIQFLQEDVGLSIPAVRVTQQLLEQLDRQNPGQGPTLLPMMLWQYRLISLEQLEKLLTWLEARQSRLDSAMVPSSVSVRSRV